jgi:hypothetical protein
MLNTETLRILKRGEQRLGLPYIAVVAHEPLDVGALFGNLALTEGRSVLCVSKESKRDFLVHASKHSRSTRRYHALG